MADKRMFSLKIVDSDLFLEMPQRMMREIRSIIIAPLMKKKENFPKILSREIL